MSDLVRNFFREESSGVPTPEPSSEPKPKAAPYWVSYQ